VEEAMPTVTEVAENFGITRDRLHYFIKVATKKRKLKPQKEGNHYILTDEDVEELRSVLIAKTKPWAAIMTMKIPGLRTEHTVNELKNQFREVVWVAGAWGDMSVIALLESGKFENIAAVPFRLREQLHYVNDSRTYIIPSDHYHVKEPPQLENKGRLSVVLVNLVRTSDEEKPSDRSVIRVVEDLGEIDAVRRYGAIFGPWDCFVEVRHSNTDELYDIVMRQIYGIRGVLDTTTILTMSSVRQEGEGFYSSSQHKEAIRA
jgi:DNA-binding Lrp family transcriptional regulator